MNVDEKAARERWCSDVHAAAMTGEWEKGSQGGDWLWRQSATTAFQLSPQQMVPFVWERWWLERDKLASSRRTRVS